MIAITPGDAARTADKEDPTSVLNAGHFSIDYKLTQFPITSWIFGSTQELAANASFERHAIEITLPKEELQVKA